MRSSSQGRGFSLLELAVYAGILMLLMGGVTIVLIAGSRYMHTGVAYQRAHSEALVGMQKLIGELGASTSMGRAPASPMVDGTHIIFLSAAPPAPATAWTYNGTNLEYHFWICYYWDAPAEELVRARLPVAGGPVTRITAPTPTAPLLSDFQPPANNDLRVVARDITDLKINDGDTTKQVRVELSSSVATASDKETIVTTRSLVQLPNP